MPDLNPQPLPPRREPVRVFVPYDVDFNLEKMNKITADVLRQLGCGGCHSGRDLEFVRMQDFVVDRQSLDVRPVVLPQATQGLQP